jgi:hypothetical protein
VSFAAAACFLAAGFVVWRQMPTLHCPPNTVCTFTFPPHRLHPLRAELLWAAGGLSAMLGVITLPRLIGRAILVVGLVTAILVSGAGLYLRTHPPDKFACLDLVGCDHIANQPVADRRSEYFFYGAAGLLVIAGLLTLAVRRSPDD